jgi:hypothetical protein
MFHQKYPDHHNINVQQKHKTIQSKNKQPQATSVSNKQPQNYNLDNKLPHKLNVDKQTPPLANVNKRQSVVNLDNNRRSQDTNIKSKVPQGTSDDIMVVKIVTDQKHGKNPPKRRKSSSSSLEFVISEDEETGADGGETKAERESPDIIQIEPTVSSKASVNQKIYLPHFFKGRKGMLIRNI